MRPVLVTWLDAVSDDDWTPIEKAIKQECPSQKTMGYLIYEDEKKIVVAASIDMANENVASVYSIPKTWLLEIKDIIL